MVQAQNAIQHARQAGKSDPIDSAADQLIAAGPVICFDEMEVSDIADAMIIKPVVSVCGTNMVLVATSNRHPDQLYLDGLHRDRFLPFIDDLNTRLDVHEIGSGKIGASVSAVSYLAGICNRVRRMKRFTRP